MFIVTSHYILVYQRDYKNINCQQQRYQNNFGNVNSSILSYQLENTKIPDFQTHKDGQVPQLKLENLSLDVFLPLLNFSNWTVV